MSYRPLGLDSNPFTYQVEDRIAPIEHPSLDVPRPGERRMVELVGAPGSGKTTQLRIWRQRSPGPYVRFDDGRPAGRLPTDPIVYWDEVGRCRSFRLVASLVGVRLASTTVVVATHRSLARPARMVGLEVTTHYLRGPTAADLAEWARRAFAASAVGAAQLPIMPYGRFADLSGGSWRVAGHLMHAWVAERAGARMKTPIR